MNNLNSIILEGNLTRDPELTKTPKGTAVCHLSVASNRYYRQDDGARQAEVSYFDVEVWARLAETCTEYLEKGRGIRVVGRLKQDRWNSSEGERRSKIKIVGEHVEFMPHFNKNDEKKNAEVAAEPESEKETTPIY